MVVQRLSTVDKRHGECLILLRWERDAFGTPVHHRRFGGGRQFVRGFSEDVAEEYVRLPEM